MIDETHYSNGHCRVRALDKCSPGSGINYSPEYPRDARTGVRRAPATPTPYPQITPRAVPKPVAGSSLIPLPPIDLPQPPKDQPLPGLEIKDVKSQASPGLRPVAL